MPWIAPIAMAFLDPWLTFFPLIIVRNLLAHTHACLNDPLLCGHHICLWKDIMFLVCSSILLFDGLYIDAIAGLPALVSMFVVIVCMETLLWSKIGGLQDIIHHFFGQTLWYNGLRGCGFECIEMSIMLVEELHHYWNNTPSVPNYFSVINETQILKNLWGICKNYKLKVDSDLNQLSNELFCIQNRVVSKKMWWFDQDRV
jgi:hypothetical protein